MFSEMLEINNRDGLSFGTASNAYQVYNEYNDKDIFESVIDGLILEKYADDELKGYIKNLPKNKSNYQRLKSVYTLLKEYVRIADVERKKHGEILTPFKELAEPMIKLVEKYDKEFWKNKNHKVLDSSAGYGTFLILAAYKFMVGLKDEFPDEEERFKWIVENCLYYGELQAKSVFSWLVAIDPHNEYKTNTYWGSFLTEDFDKHMREVWCIEKFDLIIQNPPYQMDTGNRGSGHTLWDKFVLKSLLLLNQDRYMVMVHPSGWRNLSGAFEEVKNEIYKRNLLYLEIHDIKDGIKIFNASTRFDFYCLKNSSDYQFTEVVGEDGSLENVNINRLKFIPNKYFTKFMNLTSHGQEKVNLIYSRSMYGADKSHVIRERNDIFRYPCVKYISKVDFSIDFRYTDRNNGMFGVPKVMFGIGAQVGGIIIDENGDYGLCQFVAGISDKRENLLYIQTALKSDKFKELMRACQFTTQMYNYKIIQLFRKDFWKEFI